jgi:hypothetical protein
MDEQGLNDLISKTAMLMEKFGRDCGEIGQRNQAIVQYLNEVAQKLPQFIQQSADQSMQQLSGQLFNQVQGGLEQPVGEYEKRLIEAGAQIASGSQALTQQIQRMERLHKSLIWKTSAVAIGSALLVLAGGIWLSSHYYGVIKDNQIAADLLKAYDRADVVLCGENNEQLCANVDREAVGYGNKKQYLPVESR